MILLFINIFYENKE